MICHVMSCDVMLCYVILCFVCTIYQYVCTIYQYECIQYQYVWHVCMYIYIYMYYTYSTSRRGFHRPTILIQPLRRHNAVSILLMNRASCSFFQTFDGCGPVVVTRPLFCFPKRVGHLHVFLHPRVWAGILLLFSGDLCHES